LNNIKLSQISGKPEMGNESVKSKQMKHLKGRNFNVISRKFSYLSSSF